MSSGRPSTGILVGQVRLQVQLIVQPLLQVDVSFYNLMYEVREFLGYAV